MVKLLSENVRGLVSNSWPESGGLRSCAFYILVISWTAELGGTGKGEETTENTNLFSDSFMQNKMPMNTADIFPNTLGWLKCFFLECGLFVQNICLITKYKYLPLMNLENVVAIV